MRATPAIACAAALAVLAGCSAEPGWSFDIGYDVPHDVTGEDAAPDAPDAYELPELPDVTEVTDPVEEDGPRDTVGMLCATDEDCQNGVYCDGREICPYGFCRPGPLVDCSDGVNCTLDTCNEETDSCDHVTDDVACNDSNPCTDDSCDVSTDTCVNAPRDCSDSVNCTLDTCDTSTGDCTHTVSDEACDDSDDCTIDTCDVSTDTCANTLIDGDGDLYPPESCGGDDCNDSNATIHPGATEVCGDGIDQDCDGLDGDMGTCGCPTPITTNGTKTGTTSGTSSHSPSTCGSGGGPEWVFVITPTSTRSVRFTTSGTSWDTVLYVRRSTCTTGTEVGCDDDGGYSLDSDLTVSLTGGTTYYLFLDGYSSYAYGAYTLNVSGL